MNAFVLSANQSTVISRTVAGLAIGNALRKFVGRGRDYSVKLLSNRTGVPDRLIECAMCHPEDTDYRPLKPDALLSIISVLGPEFTTEFLRPANQGAYSTKRDHPPAPGELVAECASDTAEVAHAARDGKFDHRERSVLAAVGQRHVERGMKLVAMGAM